MKNIKVMLFSSFLPQNNFFLLLWDVRHRQECVDWSNSSRARRTWILKRGHPRGARATLGVPGAPSLYVRVNKMIYLTINWQHCWYIFQWGKNGEKGKIKRAGVHRRFLGDRVYPYRMTTQLGRYLFLIWKDVCGRLLHDTPYKIFILIF